MIDIACGDGNGSRFITDNIDFELNCLGIDISESQIGSAKDMTPCQLYPRVNYQIGTAKDLYKVNYKHLHDKFDVALINWGFNYAQDVDELHDMMKSVKKVLKPNGFVIASTITSFEPDLIAKTYGNTEYNEFGMLYFGKILKMEI